MLVIGTRGAVIAARARAWPGWSDAHGDATWKQSPRSPTRIADALYGHIAERRRSSRVDIVFSRSTAGSAIGIDRYSLLPLDLQSVQAASRRPSRR